MKESLKSVPDYGGEINAGKLDMVQNSRDYSLSQAEKRSSELVEHLNSLGVPVSVPGHRVRPEEDGGGNSGEYERRVGENGTITFYSGDESSVGSLTVGGEQLECHEFGHHLGYEIGSWINDSIDYENSGIEDTDGGMEWVRAKSYLHSENFADRVRAAATGNTDLDFRSGSPEEYSGARGEKYAVGKENWEQSLVELTNNLEQEVDQMVENLSAEGWDIEKPIL